MPVYTNNTESPITTGILGTVQPGVSKVAQKYIVHLSGLTITSYGDAPWDTLHAAAPPATLTGLAKYNQIEIVNDSGASITVVANEDSTNPLTILDDERKTIKQDLDIDKLEITGDGTGDVNVTGWDIRNG